MVQIVPTLTNFRRAFGRKWGGRFWRVFFIGSLGALVIATAVGGWRLVASYQIRRTEDAAIVRAIAYLDKAAAWKKTSGNDPCKVQTGAKGIVVDVFGNAPVGMQADDSQCAQFSNNRIIGLPANGTGISVRRANRPRVTGNEVQYGR
jgi:hypothetical protein